MIYSEKQLQELFDRSDGLQRQCNDVCEEYLQKNFTDPRAREFVRHGLCRRLILMTRCIQRVFEVLPPDHQEVRDPDVIHDVTVQLQAFVFNTYGCLDNLAHIWVLEKNVTDKSERRLRPAKVGLGRQNSEVWKSLPDEFTAYMSEISDWYKNVENFRHALAHRIPFYIPPGYLSGKGAAEYKNLQVSLNVALQRRNYDEVERLEDQQAALLSFYPVATHSFGEESKVLLFHRQMLSDFYTVRDIASKLLPHFD